MYMNGRTKHFLEIVEEKIFHFCLMKLIESLMAFLILSNNRQILKNFPTIVLANNSLVSASEK